MNARRIGTWVWALAPLWTLGIGTPVVMAYAAARTRDWRQAATLPLYVAAWILMLVFADGNGHDNNLWFSLGMGVGVGVGLVHAIMIRGWVFRSRAALDPVADGGAPMVEAPSSSPARQQAQAVARLKQEELARGNARALAAKDPHMAHELGIGRPDRAGRDYPDGGLVDVNHVPVDVLTGVLGMPAALAHKIVSTRDQAGTFASYDELLMLLDSNGADLGDYADRLIFLPNA